MNSGSGFTFGSPVGLPQGQGSAVTTSVANSSISFGQPTGTQGTGTQAVSSGGLTFGQKNPNTTSNLFGQSSGGGIKFGQTTASSVPGNLSTGLFSQTSNTNALTAGSTPLFGQSLGSGLLTQTTSSSQASTNLFGQNATAATSAPGILNLPSSTSSLFGQPSNQTVASTTPLFGQPSNQAAASTTGLFVQPTNQTVVGTASVFGLSSNPVSAPPKFTGLNFGETSNPSTTGLSLVAPASTSCVSFTQTGAASSVPGFSLAPSSGGLGGISSTISSVFTSVTPSTASVGLGGSLPTSTSISSGGLGGFQTPSLESGTGTNLKGDGKSTKEAPLPQDIFATISLFESHKNNEKKCSEDNIRQTATQFHKLVEDTKKLRQYIVKLSNQHSQLHSSARKLKSSVIQEAENVEMARRTQDTPINLQGDNKSPEQFFLRLVRSFEERMTYSRNRIEEVEKCARSNGVANEITSEDMKEVLKKEHEMVKMLAAKIYTLHNQLINYTNQTTNPDLQPAALFRQNITEQHPLGISSKNSSILRPALGEGGSGLLNFQNEQQRAKAVSLGAAPPTLPLTQTPIHGLLGSSSANTMFSNPSNTGFGSSSLLNFSGSNNNQNKLGFGNKPAFGNSSTNTTSLFGNQTFNQNQSVGLFGSGGSATLFGGAKNFKK